MKVYRSNSEDKPKKRLGRKGILAIGVSAVMVVAAVAATLVITLSGGGTTPEEIDPPVVTTPAFVNPVEYVGLGKEFSNEKLVSFPTMGFWETHEGIDFLTEAGAVVKSISDGTVLSVDLNTSMDGTVIKIQHDDIVSVYKGLAAEVNVQEGQTVKAGDPIGTVGKMIMERDDYDSAHLHLEILKNGKQVNPLNYLTDIGSK